MSEPSQRPAGVDGFAFPRRFAALPAYPGEELAGRRLAILHVSAWSFVATVLLVIVGSLVGQTMPASVLVLQAASLGVGIGLMVLLRRRRERLVAIGLIVGGWATITGILAMLGTIRAPVLGHYLLCVTLAGIEFGLPGLLGTTALCSLTVAALIAAQNSGWLPVPDYTTNATQWVSATSLFAAMGLMIHGCTRLLESALDRAREELERRRAAERELTAGIEELRDALEQVKTLSGLLPLCGVCGKVREDDGYWGQFERFLESRTEAQFTHGICPDCRREHFPPKGGAGPAQGGDPATA